MSQFAEIDGARIAYETTGTGSDVVLIHAGVTDRHMWDEVVPLLGPDHRITSYDMRGFGESVAEPGFDWAPRRDLMAVMDAATIERAVVVGVSMGGGAAINATLEHPDRFNALVVVNPGLGGFDPRGDEWERALEDRIETAFEAERWDEAAELEIELWLAGPNRRVEDLEATTIERIREWLLTSYRKSPEWSRAVRMDPPAADRLREISIPTLAVLGELDVAGMAGVVDHIVAAVPGASKVLMPTAHLTPLEDPEGFVRLLRTFLA